jgi:hypothetical protein
MIFSWARNWGGKGQKYGRKKKKSYMGYPSSIWKWIKHSLQLNSTHGSELQQGGRYCSLPLVSSLSKGEAVT